jgi:hypothetical protein
MKPNFATLEGKTVIFRISSYPSAFLGTVSHLEKEGVWINANDLWAEVMKGSMHAGGIKKPLIFVPFAQLCFLIAPQE